jgi:hypothetical protein
MLYNDWCKVLLGRPGSCPSFERAITAFGWPRRDLFDWRSSADAIETGAIFRRLRGGESSVMQANSMARLVLGLVLALSTCTLARSDESPQRHHRHRYVHHWHPMWLPGERHVIEQVRNGISTDFVMNGMWFGGVDACPLGWTAGDRIKLVHGNCDGALIYNASRRLTCELVCR